VWWKNKEEEATYTLSKKGAKLLQKYQKEFLKAYKMGHTQDEANDIALDKVNMDPIEIAILIVQSVEPNLTEEQLFRRLQVMFDE
jgi:hypothetical protein